MPTQDWGTRWFESESDGRGPDVAAETGQPVPEWAVAAPEVWREAVARASGTPQLFDADNIVPNEWSTAQPLDVLPGLAPSGEPAGTLIGVGGLQNLTYAAALNVAQVVLLDVRPQNVVFALYLTYLLQMSETREAFLARLLSRDSAALTEPLADAPTSDQVDRLLEELSAQPVDESVIESMDALGTELGMLARRDLSGVLPAHHLSIGLAQAMLRLYVQQFGRYGLDLSYRSWGMGIAEHHPSLGTLIAAQSPEAGRYSFFLDRQAYDRVRALAQGWRFVPAVAGLADGDLAERIDPLIQEPVRAIYTSNVEHYLWTRGDPEAVERFVANVRALAVDEAAVLIRCYFRYGEADAHPLQQDGLRDCVFVQRVADWLANHAQREDLSWVDAYFKGPFVAGAE